jgi:ATP-dependent protease ClpP protease subunit
MRNSKIMISVSGQLTDQLRDIEDLISSLLRYLKTLITFFLRHAKNQLSYIRRLVEDRDFVKRK